MSTNEELAERLEQLADDYWPPLKVHPVPLALREAADALRDGCNHDPLLSHVWCHRNQEAEFGNAHREICTGPAYRLLLGNELVVEVDARGKKWLKDK